MIRSTAGHGHEAKVSKHLVRPIKTKTDRHIHFGDKQSTEKTGLDVLDLVRCKAEQKQ